jgi:hypothetical protein
MGKVLATADETEQIVHATFGTSPALEALR